MYDLMALTLCHILTAKNILIIDTSSIVDIEANALLCVIAYKRIINKQLISIFCLNLQSKQILFYEKEVKIKESVQSDISFLIKLSKEGVM